MKSTSYCSTPSHIKEYTEDLLGQYASYMPMYMHVHVMQCICMYMYMYVREITQTKERCFTAIIYVTFLYYLNPLMAL